MRIVCFFLFFIGAIFLVVGVGEIIEGDVGSGIFSILLLGFPPIYGGIKVIKIITRRTIVNLKKVDLLMKNKKA